MYLISIAGRETEGAYAAIDEFGTSILYIFEEEDDAMRFAMLLEEDNYPKMIHIKVDKEVAIQACELHGYEYQIFTAEDIVIPPYKQNTDFI
jgi:hypothetical protein